jgi:hypothetical protein
LSRGKNWLYSRYNHSDDGEVTMKTAISIPEPLNESIESFLKKAKMSRSEFFQRAARDYLRRVSAKAVTANLNKVHSANEHPGDVIFRRAALSHLGEILEEEE